MEPKPLNPSRAFALGLSTLLSIGPASAATVISVGDGDTLRVLDGSQKLTIRLACIDAPETAQAPYGMAARRELQRLAQIGTRVDLKVEKKDRYGRTVADIIRNGQSINLQMVRTGQAFAYRQYLAACDATAYLQAERSAERARLGVWSVPGGITRPWDWRHSRRSGSPSTIKPVKTIQPSTAPVGSRYTCKEAGSFTRAQELLRQGHNYLDGDGDGVACESLQ